MDATILLAVVFLIGGVLMSVIGLLESVPVNGRARLYELVPFFIAGALSLSGGYLLLFTSTTWGPDTRPPFSSLLLPSAAGLVSAVLLSAGTYWLCAWRYRRRSTPSTLPETKEARA